MAKAGRKRNATKRQPNGQPSRVGSADIMRAVALAQPHRAGLPAEARRDHRAENALGRLFLKGMISEAECAAGERLAARKAAFGRELASPSRARSPAGQMVADKVSSEDWERLERALSDALEDEEDRRERVLGQWASAETLVWGAVGCVRERFGLVMRVACEGLDLDRGAAGFRADLGWLRAALSALARNWGLDEEERMADGARTRLRVAVDGVEISRRNKRKAA